MRIRVPGASIARRLRSAIATRWLDHRVPREPARIRLHRRRLFILPTPLGYTFAATLALLLLGSLNYGASLGFAVTFLLAGSGALAMIHTYRNLEGIELTFSPPPAVFAGERPRLLVRLRVDAPQRWGIALAGGDGPPPVTAPAPDAPADAAFQFPPRPRGRFHPHADAAGLRELRAAVRAFRPRRRAPGNQSTPAGTGEPAGKR